MTDSLRLVVVSVLREEMLSLLGSRKRVNELFNGSRGGRGVKVGLSSNWAPSKRSCTCCASCSSSLGSGVRGDSERWESSKDRFPSEGTSSSSGSNPPGIEGWSSGLAFLVLCAAAAVACLASLLRRRSVSKDNS